MVALLAFSLVAAACGGEGVSGDGGTTTSASVTITGAGASFPYPLYSKWAGEYQKLTGTKLNYQSIGSSGGIEQIKAKTVDFGASDAPLSAAELDAAGLLQFPMTMGGVVVVVNLEGVSAGALKLDGQTLADIFQGKITSWDDAAIRVLNPDLTLPASDITVVHRSDGSGTTWIYTNYLSAVSAAWSSELGADKEIAWPVGVGGKGNEGVSGQVQQIQGSIGYVEYAYAKQIGMNTVQLENRDGAFVAPSLESFAAAAANADWGGAAGFAIVLVDQPGADSWPIVGASFILIYKEQKDAARAKALLEFFDWGYKQGQQIASSLDYVPMPDTVVETVEAAWTAEVKAAGAPVWP